MSGTSLDGVDLVFAEFKIQRLWAFKILKATTIPYSKNWYSQLSNLTSKSKTELMGIDGLYTEYLSEIIQDFIDSESIKDLDFISSHGHTALHQPEKGLTYQIGNLQAIANNLKYPVICDFRVQDVALGGQGAPLVPIGDQLLFSIYDYCLNLGGFANISFDFNKERIAFDICPVNSVLNHYASQLNLSFDNKGELARSGSVDAVLLDELNKLPFYNHKAPKSLGIEWVNKNIFPLIDSKNLLLKDVLRTFVEHIAIQISKVIDLKNKKMLVTGGGAYNSFLIERLENFAQTKITIPDANIVEYKEALIFAFLGVLKIRNEVNCLSSVTGASKNHCSGKILMPKVI